MDLFAYLGRKLLKENDPTYSIFPDEEFQELHPNAKWVIYGYYPSRDRSVGLEFWELIASLYRKYGKQDVFQYNPVFTREGGSRLSVERIDEILTDITTKSEIKRLFVWGPPPQNNMFQKWMRRISKKIGLSRDCYEIL